MAETEDIFITRCPVGCEAPLVDTDIVLPEGPLRRCASCGQLVSRVTRTRYWETMARFDCSDFNQPDGKALARRDEVARRRLGKIARLLGKPFGEIRILDVGCSRGHFLRVAAALGCEAEGVEPASSMAAAARAAGLRVHEGLLEDQRFADAAFDALTLFEVIEHLDAPRDLLHECRRILKPGGILLLSTGNSASWTAAVMKSRWDYFQIAKDAGHVSFFNPESLRRLAARCGFAVECIQTARVKFLEKEDAPRAVYAAAKLAAEMLNLPARLLGRGHDLTAFLRRPPRPQT